MTRDLTTQDLVAAERRLIAAAIGRACEGVAVVERDVLERALAAVARPLSDEQAEALRGVSTSGNGVDVIEALAGTGKTFTAGGLRQVSEDAGYRVVGIALTGRAAREPAEEAGVAASTLDRALLDLRDCHALPERTVVLLDEAGMAATRGSERLLAAAQDADAKLIATGDSGQLPPSRPAGGCASLASASVRIVSRSSCASATSTNSVRSLICTTAGPAATWSGPRRTSASSCTRTTARSPRRSRIGRALSASMASRGQYSSRATTTRARRSTPPRATTSTRRASSAMMSTTGG